MNTQSHTTKSPEQTGHAPGSWKLVIPNDQPILREIQSDRGVGICHVYHLANQSWEANARLIAAAPELLEAAKAILETKFVKEQSDIVDRGIGSQTGGGKAILSLRAAIAKAQGEKGL